RHCDLLAVSVEHLRRADGNTAAAVDYRSQRHQVPAVRQHRTKEVDLEVDRGESRTGRHRRLNRSIDPRPRQERGGTAIEPALHGGTEPLARWHLEPDPTLLSVKRDDAAEIAERRRRQITVYEGAHDLEPTHPVPDLLRKHLPLDRALIRISRSPSSP